MHKLSTPESGGKQVQRTLDTFVIYDNHGTSEVEIITEETSHDGFEDQTSVTHNVRARKVDIFETAGLGTKRKRCDVPEMQEVDVQTEEARATDDGRVWIPFSVESKTRMSKRLCTTSVSICEEDAAETMETVREILSEPRNVEMMQRAGPVSATLVDMATEAGLVGLPLPVPDATMMVVGDGAPTVEEVVDEPAKKPAKTKRPKITTPTDDTSPGTRRGRCMSDEKVLRLVDDKKRSEHTSHATTRLMERARQIAITGDAHILVMITPNPKRQESSRSRLVSVFAHGNLPMQMRRLREVVRYRNGSLSVKDSRWKAKFYNIYGRDTYIKQDAQEPMEPYPPIQYRRGGKTGIVRVDYTGVQAPNEVHPRDIDLLAAEYNNMIDQMLLHMLNSGVILTREQVIDIHRRSLGEHCMEFAPGMYIRNSLMMPFSRTVAEDLLTNHPEECDSEMLHHLLYPEDRAAVHYAVQSAYEDEVIDADIPDDLFEKEMYDFMTSGHLYAANPQYDEDEDCGTITSSPSDTSGEQLDEYEIGIHSSMRSVDTFAIPSIARLPTESERTFDEDGYHANGIMSTRSDGTPFFVPYPPDGRTSTLQELGSLAGTVDKYRNPETGEIDLALLPPIPILDMKTALKKMGTIKVHRGVLNQTMDDYEKVITSIHSSSDLCKKLLDDPAIADPTPLTIHTHTIETVST